MDLKNRLETAGIGFLRAHLLGFAFFSLVFLADQLLLTPVGFPERLKGWFHLVVLGVILGIHYNRSGFLWLPKPWLVGALLTLALSYLFVVLFSIHGSFPAFISNFTGLSGRDALYWLMKAGYEEIIFRLFLIPALLRAWPSKWFALLYSSLLFALPHLIPVSFEPVELWLYFISMGAFLGASYLASRNILLPILLHAFINLSFQVQGLFENTPVITDHPVRYFTFCAALLLSALVVMYRKRHLTRQH